MALNEVLVPSAAAPWRKHLRDDRVAVLLATLVFAGLQVAQGLPDLLTVKGDNDSLMRLVEVRDWLAGQGWFDLHQHRMGPDGGFVMHWSRLVDAPLSALVLLGSLAGGSRAAGELFAQVAWPCLMFAGCLLALVRIAKRLWGDAVMLPALVLGGAALHFPGIFALGNIDHHSFQLLLTLCMVGLLLRAAGQASSEATASSAAAGICAALMLGVGAETTPFVAVAGLFVAARFGLGFAPREEALGFGLGFAGAAALVFFGTVAPASWAQTACDAFSAPQGLLAVIGGLGLAEIAAARPIYASRAARLAALVLLGIVCAALAVTFFPQCLGDPYASIDPRLKSLWLDGVAEAQPFLRMIRNQPAMALGFYMTPLLAACVFGWCLVRGRRDARLLLPGLMLLTAIGITLWQVRGAFFALPLAAPLLAGFVAGRREAAAASGAMRTAPATAVLSWLVCLPLVWAALAVLLLPMTESEAASIKNPKAGDLTCELAETLRPLGTLPPAKVLAISNMGSLILANTPHSVLAGPYHRNTAGNLATLDAWMAEAAEARSRLDAARIGFVAFCPGNAESQMLAEAAPHGLIGELEAGRVPSWLLPVPGTEGAALRVFRVAKPS